MYLYVCIMHNDFLCSTTSVVSQVSVPTCSALTSAHSVGQQNSCTVVSSPTSPAVRSGQGGNITGSPPMLVASSSGVLQDLLPQLTALSPADTAPPPPRALASGEVGLDRARAEGGKVLLEEGGGGRGGGAGKACSSSTKRHNGDDDVEGGRVRGQGGRGQEGRFI